MHPYGDRERVRSSSRVCVCVCMTVSERESNAETKPQWCEDHRVKKANLEQIREEVTRMKICAMLAHLTAKKSASSNRRSRDCSR